MMDLVKAQREEMERYQQEMRALHERSTPAEDPRPKLPKPTLKKLEVTDNIEDFLAMFERVATQQGWPEGVGPPKWLGYSLTRQWQCTHP